MYEKHSCCLFEADAFVGAASRRRCFAAPLHALSLRLWNLKGTGGHLAWLFGRSFRWRFHVSSVDFFALKGGDGCVLGLGSDGGGRRRGTQKG